MKTKLWILLLSVTLAVCLGLSLWLMWPSQASYVQVWSDKNFSKKVKKGIDKSIFPRYNDEALGRLAQLARASA